MGVGMRRAVLGALVVAVMMSVVIVRSLRLGPREIYKDRVERCLNYMEACVPWESSCCDGMTCTNFAKGFCMHGLESCVCQLPFIVDSS